MSEIHDPADVMATREFEPIHEIPSNPDAFNEGATDPEPERGTQGAWRRKLWSWVKGWFTPA